MKYFFITASMTGGGTERVISILANNFAKKGNTVTILLTADERLDYTLENSVKLELLTSATGGSIQKRIERIRKLRQVYKNNKEAIFYSFGTETNLFAILAALGLKTNLILSERSDPNQCTFKLLRDFVYTFGPRFVFQTKQARQCFSKRIQKRSVVISNPLREDIPKSYIGVRNKSIAAVGRLISLKNYPMLIKAFAKFSEEYKEYCLEIYGQGPELDNLQTLAKDLKVEERVYFKGFHENVLEQIKAAGMYILCSNYEGVSNSLLEAMALGIPVIATDCPIGGAASLIDNEENGLLVSVGSEEELSSAMKKYAGDIEFAAKCGMNAIKVRETNANSYIADIWEQYGTN